MIRGVGVDIVKVARIKCILSDKGISKRFLERILSLDELVEYAKLSDIQRVNYVAGRWAVKEALVKCFSYKPLNFNSVTIKKDLLGKPQVIIDEKSNADLNITGVKIHVSISHEEDNLVAFAVVEQQNFSFVK